MPEEGGEKCIQEDSKYLDIKMHCSNCTLSGSDSHSVSSSEALLLINFSKTFTSLVNKELLITDF